MGAHLLGSLIELTIGLEVKVDVDEVGTSKKLPKMSEPRIRRNCSFQVSLAHLEDHAGGNDGGDAQLHEGTSVTGHHHSEPVERVGGV